MTQDLAQKRPLRVLKLLLLVVVILGLPLFIQDSISASRGLLFESIGYQTHLDNPKPARFYNTSGNITLYNQNFRGYANQRGTPLTKVNINQYGFRDENFSVESNSSFQRIIVVGDSYVYGRGVNESDRFTEVFESGLNSQSNKTYSVINAGVSGYGVQDYYNLINQRLRYYDPDHIVVAIFRNDMMSWRESKQLKNSAEDYVSNNFPDAKGKERRRRVKNRYRYLRNSQNLSGFEGLDKIAGLSKQNDFNVSFFVVDSMDGKKIRKIESLASENDVGLIKAPEEFTDDWQSAACLRYNLNRVSPVDIHPSAVGHRLLAEKLVNSFSQHSRRVEEDLSVIKSVQWVDPC